MSKSSVFNVTHSILGTLMIIYPVTFHFQNQPVGVYQTPLDYRSIEVDANQCPKCLVCFQSGPFTLCLISIVTNNTMFAFIHIHIQFMGPIGHVCNPIKHYKALFALE